MSGFSPARPGARIEILKGALSARNTAANPESIKPKTVERKHGLKDGETSFAFPPHSFTIIRL
jgi:hypothetical protein